MLFKLHYFLMAAGYNALSILLGVYMSFYTDATPFEIGLLYMLMPFVGMTCKPIISSFADRHQAHREYLIVCLGLIAVCYLPFVIVPFVGPALYKQHPRLCWNVLVPIKVIGDVSYGCALTIGDSLAINYAKRIGNELSYYRVGGTISWMIFGVITGQLNEIWFLPKYVAGFMILVLSSLTDMLAVYLWPKEYFVMVSSSSNQLCNDENDGQQLNRCSPKASGSRWTMSLMPKEVVWAHAKSQLWTLITCKCFASNNDDRKPKEVDEDWPADSSKTPIDKRSQLMALFLLFKRDPRITGYLLTFACAGATMMPLSFFYMSLSDICHTNDRCDFSQLGGLLQVSMAASETISMLYTIQIVRSIGRLNTLSIAFGLITVKYLFYGSPFWPNVNPYYSLVSEILQGITYAFYVILSNELGHLFSTEVEHLIPELIGKGAIGADDLAGQEKLKISLSATMQSLLVAASDGVGRGFGALIYGFIIGAYSFRTLWLVVGFGSLLVVIALQTVNLLGRCVKFECGLRSNGARH
jgi:hypothetical protein